VLTAARERPAEAVAGAMSMGSGSYLASQAEEQLYRSEIASKGGEIDEFPERETAELAVVLEREGLPRQQADTASRGLAANPNVFLRTTNVFLRTKVGRPRLPLGLVAFSSRGSQCRVRG
jgi:VIT family